VLRLRRTRGRTGLAVLLMPLATALVHQLRYVLAYGPRAGHELAEQGDAYVHSLLPWLMAVVLPLFFGALALALARSARGSAADPARPRRLPVLWTGAFIALLAGYVLQESLEVTLGSAHATVLSQAFGSGGWWAVPAAAIVAAAWVLVARGTHAVLAVAARVGSRPRAVVLDRDRGRAVLPKSTLRAPRACPLSRRLAGRAPPVVSLG
jgi:hypothetical protein